MLLEGDICESGSISVHRCNYLIVAHGGYRGARVGVEELEVEVISCVHRL